MILAAVLLGLLYLGGMNRTLQLAHEVDRLRRQADVLQRRVDRLALDLAQEQRSQRVVELARLRLGMTFPPQPMEVLAVAPASKSVRHSVWAYLENALVLTVEGLQRQLNPAVQAQHDTPESDPADPGGGAIP